MINLAENKLKPGEFEIIKEGTEEVMRVNYQGFNEMPSIADSASCMANTIDNITENPSIGRVVLFQRKNYIYDFNQTQILVEIAEIYNLLTKQKKVLRLDSLSTEKFKHLAPERFNALRYIIFTLLKADPLGAYVELKRIIREEKIKLKQEADQEKAEDIEKYTESLNYVFNLLEKTALVKAAKKNLEGYVIGDRTLYKEFFRPVVTPDFMLTRLMATPPTEGKELDVYSLDKETNVTLFRQKEDIRTLYFLDPPEFNISEEKYELLDLARTVLSEHEPKEEEFLDPEKMRTTFYNIGRDLLIELAENKKIDISYEEIQQLAKILVRYTVGFGLVEVLLDDQKVQDIVINGPIGMSPIFLIHQDYDECVTNIIPSREDSESWATKFRLISGRPLDEANPVLDTELELPTARARVAIVNKPLNPFGLAFAFRRHRDKPWTLPLFIDNKMINPLAAGLLSFLIDGSRTMLVAGTRSSGKSSFLGACMVEIMRKYRIVSVEDSVMGDCQILYYIKDKLIKSTVAELVDCQFKKYGYQKVNGREMLANNFDGIKVYSFDENGKLYTSPVSAFIRHKIKKPVYQVETRTGKVIKVTGDHSLFTLGVEGTLKAIKTRELKKGDYIATPRVLHFNNKPLQQINLLGHLEKIPGSFIVGLSDIIKEYSNDIKSISLHLGYPKAKGHTYPAVFQNWKREGILPSSIVIELLRKGIRIDPANLKIKLRSQSTKLPLLFNLDEKFLTFAGLWLADGCYDQKSVIISSPQKECEEIINAVAKKLGIKAHRHSDGFSLTLHSNIFKIVMKNVLELKGDAYTKKAPSWTYNLSNAQLSHFLKGIYSGDGYITPNEVAISLVSKELIKDIQTFLLSFGIVSRINKMGKDKTFSLRISATKFLKNFQNVGFLQKHRNHSLSLLCSRISTHDTTDIIPFTIELKNRMESFIPTFNYNDYVVRDNNIGRDKFNDFMSFGETPAEFVYLETAACSDIFWDEVKKVTLEGTTENYVYDFSVPENENFVCENIIAHNTLELPTTALRKLGYNIQTLKVRSALTAGGTELSAEEGIRTSLRLGDSALIVGEVRSSEAKSLYEAMRVGALANVVAGTIHGDSPYGVFDRVVNDIGIPETSFKATDIIVIANPIKSPDGLQRWRRVVSITEVRKHWEKDPLREKGFVDLMRYNPKTDQLEPTPDLINGDSEILKAIGGAVKEWAGNWDSIWDNIVLRAKIKETLVDYANKTKNPELIEADFVALSNDVFHRFSGEVREETGKLDSKKIFSLWEDWLKKEAKGKKK